MLKKCKIGNIVTKKSILKRQKKQDNITIDSLSEKKGTYLHGGKSDEK